MLILHVTCLNHKGGAAATRGPLRVDCERLRLHEGARGGDARHERVDPLARAAALAALYDCPHHTRRLAGALSAPLLQVEEAHRLNSH